MKKKSTLNAIYLNTSFAREASDEPIGWGDLQLMGDGTEAHVPECSMFGNTLISLIETYELSGNDCLFLQELVRRYRSGELVEK